MNKFRTITPKEIDDNAFKLIGEDWALVTCGDKDNFNTMTVSWGGVGVLWNKNVATIFIRPQRYTYEFLEKNDEFTVSFFDGSYKSALAFCGKKSGRDCDKVKECGLTPLFFDNSVAFSESKLVFKCKKLYFDDLKSDNFIDSDIECHYPNKDYHRMYIAEIIEVLEK